MAEENEIYTADDRLIVALDVDSFDKMKALVDELGDLISYYKVGMELYYSAGSDTIRYLKEHGKKVFLDLKLHDIPNTVGHSVASVTRLGVNLITVQEEHRTTLRVKSGILRYFANYWQLCNLVLPALPRCPVTPARPAGACRGRR